MLEYCNQDVLLLYIQHYSMCVCVREREEGRERERERKREREREREEGQRERGGTEREIESMHMQDIHQQATVYVIYYLQSAHVTQTKTGDNEQVQGYE